MSMAIKSEIYGNDMGVGIRSAGKMDKLNAGYIMALAESSHAPKAKKYVSFEFAVPKRGVLNVANVLEARALLTILGIESKTFQDKVISLIMSDESQEHKKKLLSPLAIEISKGKTL